jgi:Amt family ammonium transporter
MYGAINWTPLPLWAKFLLQLVFGHCRDNCFGAPWRSGSSSASFMIFSFILVAVIYPSLRPLDLGWWCLGSAPVQVVSLATSATSPAHVVHSVGGWAALAGVLILGRGNGKFKDGKITPIPGHNMTSAALGV